MTPHNDRSPMPRVALAALALTLAPAALASPVWSSTDLVEVGDQAVETDPAAAQLAWQRARLLDPAAVEGRPVHGTISTPLLTAHGWSWILFAGLGLTLGGVGALQLTERKALALAVSIAGATLVTASGVVLDSAAEVRDLAVTGATELRVSPAKSAPELAALEPGTLVSVQALNGDFARVTAPAGAGWMPLAQLTHVVPDP